MPTTSFSSRATGAVTLALVAVSLSGCATAASSSPATSLASSPSAVSAEEFDMLLDIERAGVAVLADQWTNNDCSVDLALSPDDIVCADVLAGADLTATYEDLTGGLERLAGDPQADAVRTAFAESVDAGAAWSSAGCAVDFGRDCADEGERLMTTLLALDMAFDSWNV